MFQITDIRRLHIEPTNTCQARCPQCMRTPTDGTVNNWLNDELTLDLLKTQIPDYFWAQLDEVLFNGTTGDSLAHKELDSIVEYIRDRTDAVIQIHTNGGLGSTRVWERLAKILRPTDVIIFGIDGLADTNHLYRVGVNYDLVMKNANTFISAGGSAVWQFIVFKHNEHQIDLAKQLSCEMKFKNFVTRSSGRFDSSGRTEVYIDKQLSHVLEKSTITPAQLEPERRINILTREIDCESIRIKWLGIYADGTVWPCCHLMGWHKTPQFNLSKLVQKKLINVVGDYSLIDLHHHTLETIINGPVFQNRYPDSFNSRQPIPICVSECRKIA